MYDRRVVRGNTFAALVIPVSKNNCFYQFRHAGWSWANRKAKARLDDAESEKRTFTSNWSWLRLFIEKKGRWHEKVTDDGRRSQQKTNDGDATCEPLG